MRKDAICTPVLFLFSLLLLPSCIATQHDVSTLNRQIRTLNKEVANMKSVREKQAETGAEMDSVKQEIQRVSGGQEENKNLIKHIIERDTSEQEDQNARLLKLEKKIEKLYYSIGEVAKMFDVNTSLIRFWEKEFDIIKPKKNKKGNHLFTKQDIENFYLIFYLVKERGMTLKGVKKKLKDNKEDTINNFEVINSLQKIKKMLLEIKEDF